MRPTPDKALAAALLMFAATIAGALLEGTFTLATLGVALGAGLAGGIAVYRIPYYRQNVSGDRRRRSAKRARRRRGRGRAL